MKDEEEDKLVNAIIALQQSMEKQLGKVNLGLQELRTSYVKLDSRVEKLDASFNRYAESNERRMDNYETRIVRLETRGSSFVAEPKAEYKKLKKKK